MTFEQWKSFASSVHDRADRIRKMRSDRGWTLAATVGIGRCGCSLHNASIDTECRGWSAPGPHVWKTARAAIRLTDDFTASSLADRIISRAWDSVSR